MAEGNRCAACGFVGRSEEVVPGLSVCPACGERVDRPEASRGPLHRPRFRYRRRALGPLVHVWHKLVAPTLRDELDRPLARIRARPSMARLRALAVGAAALTLALLASVALLGWLEEGSWMGRVLLYAAMPSVLAGAIALVTRLSPGPDLLVVATGRDPRLLLRIRPNLERGFVSVLTVEDAEGWPLGDLTLYRLRDMLWWRGHAGPLIEIVPTAGAAIVVRRASAFLPGWVFEMGERRVGHYALNGGLGGRDELVVEEPESVDPRLLVAAMLVARP